MEIPGCKSNIAFNAKNPCKTKTVSESFLLAQGPVHDVIHKLQHTLSTKDKHLECAYEHKITGFLVCGVVLAGLHAAQLFATCDKQ